MTLVRFSLVLLVGGCAQSTAPVEVASTSEALGATGSPDYYCPNVYCDNAHDDTIAINSCLQAAAVTGGNALLPGGICTISGTIIAQPRVALVGECAGASFSDAPTPPLGTVLSWSSAASGATAVSYTGVQRSALRCVTILNSAHALNSIGLHYDSDNNPPSSENDFGFFTIQGFHQGLVVGRPDDGVTSNCAANPNQSGCYEMDSTTIHDGLIAGDGSDTSAEGIHINSANALQQSAIISTYFSLENIGVHIVSTNGGLRIERCSTGSVVPAGGGSESTLFTFEAGVVQTPDLFDNETEGTSLWYAVHDRSCNAAPGRPSWIGNQFFNHNPLASGSVLVDGCEHITSIGNQNNAADFVAAGSSQVLSLSEASWITQGSGTLSTWNEHAIQTNDVHVMKYLKVGAVFNPNMAEGDLSVARSPTLGVIWLGSDANGWIDRDGQGDIRLSRPLLATTTDQVGQLIIPSGASSVTYTFTGSYSGAPTCTATLATPVTTAPPAMWIGATTSALTVHQISTFSAALTYNYICFPHN